MTQWMYVSPEFDGDSANEKKQWPLHLVVNKTGLVELRRRWDRNAKAGGYELGRYKVEPRDLLCLDLGGPMMGDAKVFEKNLRGLHLKILAIHVSEYLNNLGRAIQEDPKVDLWNIGNWPVLLVATASYRAAIENWLRSILPEALAFADAENTHFNESIRKTRNTKFMPRPVRKGVAEA